MAVQTTPAPTSPDTPTAKDREHPWPRPLTAYFGLAVIILATMLNFFDASVFGMMMQRIKVDFSLSDEQLGFLVGPANVLFYVIVGIPLARLVDIYPRKLVLSAGIAIIGGITALGGLAQSFVQLFLSRMMIGAGGSAHAPGSYSMISDYFPPHRRVRAFGWLQLGFIGGNSLGLLLGGQLVYLASTWPVSHWFGLTIHGWQKILMLVGAPGLVIAVLFLVAKEPERRGVHSADSVPTFGDVFAEIRARGAVYYPLFIGLALATAQMQGLGAWRVPFFVRTYGWREDMIGQWLSAIFFIGSILGALIGTVVSEWMSKRYPDTNVRVPAIFSAIAAPFEIAALLMPTPALSLMCMGVGTTCGLASAVPQNAAIQRIAPNAMRGRITAIYLFMFIAFGALGSQVVGTLSTRLFGGGADLWKSLVLVACILLPLAAFSFSRAIRPYGAEVARLEALERAAG